MKKGQAACCRRSMSPLLHIYSAFDNPAGLMNILCDFFSVSRILSSCQAWDLTSSSVIFFPSYVHLVCYFPSPPTLPPAPPPPHQHVSLPYRSLYSPWFSSNPSCSVCDASRLLKIQRLWNVAFCGSSWDPEFRWGSLETRWRRREGPARG